MNTLAKSFLVVTLLLFSLSICRANEIIGLILKGGDLRVILPGIPDDSSYSTFDLRGEAAAAAKESSLDQFLVQGIPIQIQTSEIKNFAPSGGSDEDVLQAYLDWEKNYHHSNGAKVRISEQVSFNSGTQNGMRCLFTIEIPQKTITLCFESLRVGQHIVSFVAQIDDPGEKSKAWALLRKISTTFKTIPRPFTKNEQIRLIKQQQEN